MKHIYKRIVLLIMLLPSTVAFAGIVTVPAPGFTADETYQRGHTQKGNAVATCDDVGNIVPIADKDFHKICDKKGQYMVQCRTIHAKASNGVTVAWRANVSNECIGDASKVTVDGARGLAMVYRFPNGVAFSYTPEIPAELRRCHYASNSHGFLTCQG